MNPRKILVGVDFAVESELAARQALEVARRIDGELILVHGGETVELPELGEHATPAGRAAFEDYRAALARAQAADRERLANLRERLAGQGPDVSVVMSEDFPATALCRAAEELAVDLVVVGTHGRTGLRWFLLGSVAEHVVRCSSVDVLVARREGAGRGGFRRILVATDFAPSSERALDRAVELAASEARVDVVYCLGPGRPARSHADPAIAPVALPAHLELEIVASIRDSGASLLEGRRRPGLELSFQVLPGPPVPGIVHQLESSSYDLVALGTHGRRGFRPCVLGTVAETVARRAPCSVLVARGRG